AQTCTISLHAALPIWRLVESGKLLAQFQHVARPVARRVEPRKAAGKGRVVPAPREPGAVVHQPQGTQRFDQAEFGRVEAVKGVRSEEHTSELQSRENL